jgi:cation diffusion facilitator CzcD-associated flavoprotein CzcO
MPELTHLEKIRNQYAQERARRIRADGTSQYVDDATGDQWAETAHREPLRDRVDVAIIGAGLSGLTCAVELRKAGLERIRLVDRAGDVGGTWYWNRYPAAQCDVESYIYLPYLEELGFMPSQKYVYQPEILKHLQSVASKYDLYKDSCFHTDVTEMTWNDADGLWTVHTDRGDAFEAQFLVTAGGFLQRPKRAGIPGLSEFQGKVFHSSRWDYGYTGGGPGRDGGGLPGLRDKRVGLIGTGASGLQILTPLAEAARQVYVFQRTPVVVLPRNNRPTDPDWAGSLEPGWHRQRMETFTRLGNGYLHEDDPIQDGWTQVVFKVMMAAGAGFFGGPQEREHGELVDLETMDSVRQRVADLVKDPETAASLMPYFRLMCKRPSFHDEYLQSYNRPNVTLVDTHGKGPEKFTETAAVVEGREYEIDCLILATGFDLLHGVLNQWRVDAVGRDGLRLSDYWQDGLRTFQGIFVHNFPNLFLHSTTQTAGPPNYTSSSIEISEQIAHAITQLRERGCRRIEATAEAEAEWVHRVRSIVPEAYRDYTRACTPGFYNNEGDVDSKSGVGRDNYMAGAVVYYDFLRSWRADAAMPGVEMQ